jgi:hypothetical protein
MLGATQFNLPIPNYRFLAILDRAKALTGAVVQLGGALLSALEKRDAEALALLRASQEKAVLKLTTHVKEQQIEEIKQTAQSLKESLDGARGRQTYYNEQIQNGLSPGEIANIALMTVATVFNALGAQTRGLAAISSALPQVGSPFAMTYGGQQLGAALNAASGVLDEYAILSNFGAQLSITLAQYERRKSEWKLQADLAGFDAQRKRLKRPVYCRNARDDGTDLGTRSLQGAAF